MVIVKMLYSYSKIIIISVEVDEYGVRGSTVGFSLGFGILKKSEKLKEFLAKGSSLTKSQRILDTGKRQQVEGIFG